MARVLSLLVSGSRKKSEYADIVDAVDEEEAIESGDEESDPGRDDLGYEAFSCGKSTAIVPP